jgi:hypothetical protein
MIKLELDVNEVNAVMTALGQMPYVQVEQLVAKIRQQAIPQVQVAQQEQPAEAQ